MSGAEVRRQAVEHRREGMQLEEAQGALSTLLTRKRSLTNVDDDAPKPKVSRVYKFGGVMLVIGF